MLSMNAIINVWHWLKKHAWKTDIDNYAQDLGYFDTGRYRYIYLSLYELTFKTRHLIVCVCNIYKS